MASIHASVSAPSAEARSRVAVGSNSIAERKRNIVEIWGGETRNMDEISNEIWGRSQKRNSGLSLSLAAGTPCALASRNHGGWPLANAIGREEVSIVHRRRIDNLDGDVVAPLTIIMGGGG